MFTLMCDVEFHGSHFLPGYDGDCSRVHGHNWKITAEYQSDSVDANGLAVDFRTIKKAVREVMPDHVHLNEWMEQRIESRGLAPSTENVAHEIFNRIVETGVPITAIVLQETDRSRVRYEPKRTVQP